MNKPDLSDQSGVACMILQKGYRTPSTLNPTQVQYTIQSHWSIQHPHNSITKDGRDPLFVFDTRLTLPCRLFANNQITHTISCSPLSICPAGKEHNIRGCSNIFGTAKAYLLFPGFFDQGPSAKEDQANIR